jgi:hypothetical protein
MKSFRPYSALLVLLPVLWAGAGLSWAQVPEGRYRVDLMSGKYVEGDLKELPDGSYEVRTRHGVTLKIRKNEVRQLRALQDATPAPVDPATENPAAGSRTFLVPMAVRYTVEDEEIEALLSGVVAEPDDSLARAGRDDLMAPLPVNEDSLEEMLRQAGLPRGDGPLEDHENVLLKDHFAMVFTSSPDSARELGSRLESVYRWNVKFMSMMKLPARQPEYKLEIYYFGDYEEFERYSLNQGSPLSPGTMGYYKPDINRAHFFDVMTYPDVKQRMAGLKRPGISWREKQTDTNWITRLVEHMNVEVIQHETGHQIHFNIGLFPIDGLEREASVPIWLVEGTTMLFEVPPGSAGASLGALNHSRLFGMRERFGWHPLDLARWKLFLIDNAQWFGSEWGVAESYNLGWCMVYYLWKEKRDGYAKYLQAVFGREEKLGPNELEAEFVRCFGEVNEKWINDFYKFLDSLELRPSACAPSDEQRAQAQNIRRRNQGANRPQIDVDSGSRSRTSGPPGGGRRR